MKVITPTGKEPRRDRSAALQKRPAPSRAVAPLSPAAALVRASISDNTRRAYQSAPSTWEPGMRPSPLPRRLRWQSPPSAFWPRPPGSPHPPVRSRAV